MDTTTLNFVGPPTIQVDGDFDLTTSFEVVIEKDLFKMRISDLVAYEGAKTYIFFFMLTASSYSKSIPFADINCA